MVLVEKYTGIIKNHTFFYINQQEKANQYNYT